MKSVLASGGIAILCAATGFGQSAAPARGAAAAPGGIMTLAAQQAFVSRYCAGCHNDKLKSGGFSWSKIDLAHPEQNAPESEKVVKMLHAGMMPKAGAPRPDANTIKAFANSMEIAVDRAAVAQPNPGTPDLHRLNRAEYHNSVRDLLGVDVDVAQVLPPDDVSHGFDNMADALSVTPALMQGYVRAASKISREALGDPLAAPAMASFNVPKVVNQTRHVDGAPFGTRGGVSVVNDFPADGEYTFKVVLYYDYLETLFGQTLSPNIKDQQVDISVDGERVWLFKIDPNLSETKSNYITAPIKVTAGPHRISAAFIKRFDGPVEDEFRNAEQDLVNQTASVPGLSALPHLHTFTVTGPMKAEGISETPSRRRILTCRPTTSAEEIPCARKIITTLARQAYRKPATDADTEELLGYYQQGRNDGDFESGIRMAVQAILANPQFVFRFERTPAGVAPGKNYRISDLELASRLSYFLWSSAPDDQLIAVAGQNKLHEPAILDKQVRRMLSDPKSEALADNFAYQWLHLQNLKDVDPDGMMFPNFTRNLAQSMVRETKLLFDSIVRFDRSPVDLLTANYTYVDEILARYYGIPNIVGNDFHRVALTDPNRYGLLGQGSILTLTSIANRTSPVQRGKYVMEVMLGTPPPVPPPNVPPLKENARNEKALSVRERMEQHRANEPCHSCHQMMDPIGLALENFDAVGIWRTNDSGFPIDASGQMFDGTKLDGPISLRNAILSHSDAFIGNFTENLMAYGVGRVLDYKDMPMVRTVEREAARNNNRFSAFVLGIVKSPTFQMRRADEPGAVTVDVAQSGKPGQSGQALARH